MCNKLVFVIRLTHHILPARYLLKNGETPPWMCIFFFFSSSQEFSSLPSSIQHKEIHMGAFWNGFARIYTWHLTRQLPCKAPIRCPFDVMHNAVADDKAGFCVLMTIVLTVNETNVLFCFQRLLRVCSKSASLSFLYWIVNICNHIYFRS